MNENKVRTNTLWLAIFSAVIATFSAIFTGCQAYEAHRANENARMAIKDTRSANERAAEANERAAQAQSKLADLQERQATLQHRREERRMAELVFLDNSPTSITDYRPDATWSVKNYNSQPISGVWVKTTTDDGRTIVWKIGDVGACEVKGIANTMAYGSPAFVYFADPDDYAGVASLELGKAQVRTCMLRSEATKKDRVLSGRTTPQDQPVWQIALGDPQATNSPSHVANKRTIPLLPQIRKMAWTEPSDAADRQLDIQFSHRLEASTE